MGYQVYEDRAARDLGVERWAGYGVPAVCDHPDCAERIDRGMDRRCGEDVGDTGCGLSFCGEHLVTGWDEPQMCARCCDGTQPFTPKPDTLEWERWILADGSWAQWRNENPDRVAAMRARVMLTPERIQQRRVKGWRMPEDTVSVARPHRWGNPFRIGTDDAGRIVVRDAQGVVVARALSVAEARRAAVDLHRASITPELAAEIRQHLAGKNLACFCALTDACHADTYLEIANGDPNR